MDVMSGLAAVSKGIEIVKALRDLEGQANDASFKLQIAELHSALADAKIALADAREELATKDREIMQLREVEAGKMAVVSYRGYSFGIDDEGTPIGRPFCPVCEKSKGMQIQITRGVGGHDLCPQCHGVYGRGGYPWQLPKEKWPQSN